MKQTIIYSALATLLFGFFTSFAQTKISGFVKGKDGSALPGVNVTVKGTSKSTQTGFDGNFLIDASDKSTLVLSYIGFETKEISVNGRTNLSVILQDSDTTLQEVVLIGSRNPKRTVTESTVPIDVINMKEIASQGAQTNLNQILNMVAPSFTSNTQTVADGTDHIDPAQLRGLGPDQVLVLLNGKRRHTSSLVNINGTPGRGAVGTDLNAIPAFAIDKIEVLRDGASAQYGSDAIAGVININMKKDTKKLEVNMFAGSNFSKGANNHNGGNDGNNFQFDLNYGTNLGKEKSFINVTASAQFRGYTSRANEVTGTLFNAYNAIEERARRSTGTGAFAPVNINTLFGNINNTPNSAQILTIIKNFAPQVSYFTPAQQANIAGATTIGAMQTALNFDATAGELAARGLERSAFNMRVGQSSLESTQFFVNAAYPLTEKLELYAFGGNSYRTGEAAGFYRRPNQSRAYTGLYPNGFLPEIHSTINDISAAAGLRGKIFGQWNFDFSNTYGVNSFDYGVENSANATLKQSSPKIFNAGGLAFRQNTTNLDVNQKFGDLNVAFGAEYRNENFKINDGQPESYLSYDINGNVQSGLLADALLRTTDFYSGLVALSGPYGVATIASPTTAYNGNLPGGSQVFPGFRAANKTNKGRESYAAYADLEYDVTDRWLTSAAVRYEKYSDFGNTTNFKFATRYKVTDNINIRGAISTGFRAPSLHQLYFNSTATQFVGGAPFEVGTFSNDSKAAQALGIPQLKQEESKSASIGFTAKFPKANVTLTADAYFVRINDRVVLTDQFARPSGIFLPGTPQRDLQDQFDAANATAATFFANAINTESKGIDIVVTHKFNIGAVSIKSDLAATFSQTRQVGDIKASPTLVANGQINRYYSETSRVYLEEAVPRTKANLTNSFTYKKFDVFLRNVYFGQVTDPNTVDVDGDGFIGAAVINGQAVETEHPIWAARIITDLSFGYALTKNTKIVVGANNLFDLYPDLNYGPVTAKRPANYNPATGVINPLVSGVDASGNVIYNTVNSNVDLSNANQFVYSRNVSQFGQNGRFAFVRLNYKF